MTFYVTLPAYTENLLRNLIDIEKDPNITKNIFRYVVEDFFGNSPHYQESIETLKAARYLTNEEDFVLTDIGAEYFYLKRRHFLEERLTPGLIALAVSLITNFVIYVAPKFTAWFD